MLDVVPAHRLDGGLIARHGTRAMDDDFVDRSHI